jgi:hypothetical protein
MLASAPMARADQWETDVSGSSEAKAAEAILEYKRGQAAEVYTLFYGLRDRLYTIRPIAKTSQQNSLYTPQTVSYEVSLTAQFNSTALTRLKESLGAAAFLEQGDNAIEIAFPTGSVTIYLYDEILPTFKVLTMQGYALEARAVLLDKDRTVLAVSDNSLLVRTKSTEKKLDFSGSPLLQTYVPQQMPDIRALLDNADAKYKDVGTKLSDHFKTQSYVLQNADKAIFYALPIETLRKTVSMRVLRESDELILYKRDK